jgi:hypothetical protein
LLHVNKFFLFTKKISNWNSLGNSALLLGTTV